MGGARLGTCIAVRAVLWWRETDRVPDSGPRKRSTRSNGLLCAFAKLAWCGWGVEVLASAQAPMSDQTQMVQTEVAIIAWRRMERRIYDIAPANSSEGEQTAPNRAIEAGLGMLRCVQVRKRDGAALERSPFRRKACSFGSNKKSADNTGGPKGRPVCAQGWCGGCARNQEDTSRPTIDRRSSNIRQAGIRRGCTQIHADGPSPGALPRANFRVCAGDGR